MHLRVYLRSREDTVRCVVSGLLDDSPSDLADELVKGESLQLDDGSADEENEDWEKWVPDPVDADPGKLFIIKKKKYSSQYLLYSLFQPSLPNEGCPI